jgi:hypothetical protein
MGDSNSTLPLPLPLVEKVKELDPWHTLKNPGLGVGFTENEKHEWWKSKDYKYKLGTIRSIDLDTIITIYSETFDMSKKQRRIKKDPSEKDIEPLTDKNIEKIRTNTSINLGDFDEELIEGNLDTMKTVTQFEDLYFGWIPLKEADKASLIIKETMKTLFRFVFGKKTINSSLYMVGFSSELMTRVNGYVFSSNFTLNVSGIGSITVIIFKYLPL